MHGRKALKNQSHNKSHNTDVTLEDLLALVEKAVGAIERLQDANATLTARLHAQTSATQVATAELEHTALQIEELERAAAALRKDAQWCRWFRNKYGGANFSSFFWHIEREYLAEHPEESNPESEDRAQNHVELSAPDSKGLH